MTVNPNQTPAVTISSLPVSPFCSGTAVTFSAISTGTGGGVISYNFKLNGTTVQSGASNTYSTATLVNGDIIKCIINITGGTCLSTNTTSSGTLTMTVNSNLSPTVKFTSTATNTGGGVVSYNFTSNSTAVQSGASNTFSSATLTNGNVINCTINIAGGSCLSTNTATSGTITMTVTSNETPTMSMSAVPSGVISHGTPVTFFSTATNTKGGSITYNFKLNGTTIQSGTSNICPSATFVNRDVIGCTINITGGMCLSTNTASSSTITMTVNSNQTPTVNMSVIPSGAICSGTPVTFTSTTTNTGSGKLSYNFKVNGTTVQSGASNTFSTATLANGDVIIRTINITGGTCLSMNTASSGIINMTINANQTPTVSLSALPSGSICAGTPVTFTSTATNTADGVVSYNLKLNGTAVQSGASNTFSTSTLVNGDVINCTINIVGGPCQRTLHLLVQSP